MSKLLTVYASRHKTTVDKVSFLLDGERMSPTQTLDMYDLEGDELIDASIASL